MPIIFIVHPALDVDAIGFLPAEVFLEVVNDDNLGKVSADGSQILDMDSVVSDLVLDGDGVLSV